MSEDRHIDMIDSRVASCASITKIDSRPRPFVLILGMHRSGTSLCSSIVHSLGIDMVDDNDPGAPGNETGHWERFDIMQIHDNILNVFNQNWHSLHALPALWWRDPAITPYKKQLADLLPEQSASSQWGFKDPRTLRLFPMWNEIFCRRPSSFKVILCIRNPRDVAQSLIKRDNFDLDYCKLLWIRHYADFFLHNFGAEYIVIDYDSWFSDFKRNIVRLQSFLELEDFICPHFYDSILEACIRPSLKHHSFDLEADYCSYLYTKIRDVSDNDKCVDELRFIFSNLEKIDKYYASIFFKNKLLIEKYEQITIDLNMRLENIEAENTVLQERIGAAEVRDLESALGQERLAAQELRTSLQEVQSERNQRAAEVRRESEETEI